MNTPLVSIFVQTYNFAPHIGACIESILSLRGGFPLEIIVIDDASTDDTDKVVRGFKDNRLNYLRHEKNRGSNATANEGYAWARGKYIARIDGDDSYRPCFLEKTVPVLESHPKVGLAYGDIALIDEKGAITVSGGNVRRNGRPPVGNEFFPLLIENYIPAPTTIMRREALLPLLPVPSDFGFLDWYLTTGIAEQWDSAYVDEVLADYRIHSTNMHRSMVRDGTGERTSFQVLDRLFANSIRAEEKRKARALVYGRNYLVYADKYFGSHMDTEARRCFWHAVRHHPPILFKPGVARRFAATLTNREWYEWGKKFLRGKGSIKREP